MVGQMGFGIIVCAVRPCGCHRMHTDNKKASKHDPSPLSNHLGLIFFGGVGWGDYKEPLGTHWNSKNAPRKLLGAP